MITLQCFEGHTQLDRNSMVMSIFFSFLFTTGLFWAIVVHQKALPFGIMRGFKKMCGKLGKDNMLCVMFGSWYLQPKLCKFWAKFSNIWHMIQKYFKYEFESGSGFNIELFITRMESKEWDQMSIIWHLWLYLLYACFASQISVTFCYKILMLSKCHLKKGQISSVGY